MSFCGKYNQTVKSFEVVCLSLSLNRLRYRSTVDLQGNMAPFNGCTQCFTCFHVEHVPSKPSVGLWTYWTRV